MFQNIQKFKNILNNNNLFKKIKNIFIATNNNAIIHNKIILYIIFFISLGDLFILLTENDIFSISVFILVGVLTTYFSKNMLIVLFISLVVTNLLKYGSSITTEGFDGNNEDDDEEEEEEEDKKDKKDKKEKKEKKDFKEELSTSEMMEKISKITNSLKNI